MSASQSPRPDADESRLGAGIALLLTLAAAGLYGLAFPTLSWRPLAWVAVAPLLVALRSSSPARALGLAYLFAVAGAWSVAAWVPASISLYFDQSESFGVLFFLLLASLMVAPYYVAFAGVHALLARRFDLLLPLLTACSWTAAEWGRSALFTAAPVFSSNPWGLLAYSQAGATLQQLVAVTGIFGITFVLLLVNATLAELFLAAWRGRLSSRRAAAQLGIAGVPALAAFAYAFGVLAAAPPPADRAETAGPDAVPVALVQGHIGLAERWHRHFHGRNLRKYLELSHEILGEGETEILFWPEAAMTFAYADQPGYQRAIAGLLRSAGVELVAGIPHPDEAGSYFNSVYLLSEDAELRARYDKQHLLPWAEYIPLGTLASVRKRFERFKEFHHGAPSPPLPTRAGPAGVLLCNEAALPEVARQRAREGAVYLVNPANDSWSRNPRFSAQWFDIVSLRAIEQRRSMVRTSTSGPSVILDPWGRILAQGKRLERSAIRGWVVPRHGLSLYGRLGDLFAALCTGAALLGALLALRAGRDASSAPARAS